VPEHDLTPASLVSIYRYDAQAPSHCEIFSYFRVFLRLGDLLVKKVYHCETCSNRSVFHD
jgi:hypothetical protein